MAAQSTTTLSPSESVTLNTFNKWPFSSDFSYEVGVDGRIKLLQCKICTEHITQIRKQAKTKNISGKVLDGLLAYIDGVTYIHKSNVQRHVRSGSLHDWAKQNLCTNQDTATAGTSSNEASDNEARKPGSVNISINQMFHKNLQTQYTSHFNTALSIVMKERPMSDYSELIDLQKKNGVQFVSKGAKSNDKSCREFIQYLASAMREDMKAMLKCANLFSCEMDGTEARKTRDEKELIYVKLVVNGQPIELFLKCQKMSKFGGVDALCLKNAIDDAFANYNMSDDKWRLGLVSACADGASVNMGKLSGALTVMKREGREWLLIIHCAAHKIELAVKDAFKSINDFEKIDEMCTNLYYFFKNSGKCWRILLHLAERLNVVVTRLPKAAGTRFQVHKYRAIKALIVNFLPLCLFAENMLEASNKACKPDQKAKLRGYLKHWLDYGHLSAMHLYRLVLRQTAHLSYLAQSSTPLITDVINGVKEVIDELNTLGSNHGQQDELQLPFAGTMSEDGTEVVISAESTNLPATLRFKTQNQMTEKQKKKAEENVSVVRESFTLKNVHQGKKKVSKIKDKLIPAIASSIQKRMESFDDPIFKAFSLVDHTQWDLDQSDYGKSEIKQIATHFSECLTGHNFSLSMVLLEWRNLKRLVSTKFHHFKNSLKLWQQIFTYHHNEHPHILLVIELILSIAIASASVERGISTLNRIMSDSRTSLSSDTLDDLLLLRINLPVLSHCDPFYEQKLVSKAVHQYIEDKNRRTTSCRKRQAAVPVDTLRSDTERPDTYLPTPASKVIKLSQSELLETENFLQGVDSESEIDDDYEIRDSDSSEDSDSDIEISQSQQVTQATGISYQPVDLHDNIPNVSVSEHVVDMQVVDMLFEQRNSS